LVDKGSLVGVPNWGVWFTNVNHTAIFDDSPGDSIPTHFLDNFGKVEWLIPGVASIGNEDIFYFVLRGWTTGNFNQIQYGSKGKCSLNVNERRDWLGWQVTSVRAGI